MFISASAYAITFSDCNSGGRYEDNGNGTVTDCRTGLIWQQYAKCINTSGGIANPTGILSWHDAMKWTKGLGSGLCGLTDGSSAGDWRLPTKTEWMAMVTYAKKMGWSPAVTNGAGTAAWTTDGDIFYYVQPSLYWLSTTSANGPNLAWYGYMVNGNVDNYSKTAGLMYVWSVRGGQSATFDSLILE